MSADPAVGFWLRWADAEGAVHEPATDAALVLLPHRLAERLGVPEELTVTGDPEVARDDGAVLLAPGHPLLDEAAESVLGDGDVGQLTVSAPVSAAPDATALLERARASFPVDHGRLDLREPPTPALLPVLRVGALVSYAVSFDDRFQERAEVWVDVEAGVGLPDPTVQRLAAAVSAGEGTARAPAPGLDDAVLVAHRMLDEVARHRCHELAGDAADARAGELARAAAYYDAELATLARRRSGAPPEKWQVLDARAEATRAERARRLAEVEEKFRTRHELRPYRLHLLWVPSVRLPISVYRGRREFPLTLHWLRPAAAFTPVPCPLCARSAPLVAAKDRLGCRQCLPHAATIPPPSPSPPAPAPRLPAPPPPRVPRPPASPPRAAPPPPALRSSPAPAAPVAAGRADRAVPARLAEAANRLAFSVWQGVADGDRRVRRFLAADSPAAALHRLYGAAGPAYALGLLPGEQLVESSAASLIEDTRPGVTSGVVWTSVGTFAYSLRWLLEGGHPRVAEVLPTPGAVGLRLPWASFPDGLPPLLRADAPAPRIHLDPIADALWRVELPAAGLLVVARCLAAWWRIADHPEVDGVPPGVAAAALAHQVGRRAGRLLTFAAAGAAYDVDSVAVRGVATRFTRWLQLATDRCW